VYFRKELKMIYPLPCEHIIENKRKEFICHTFRVATVVIVAFGTHFQIVIEPVILNMPFEILMKATVLIPKVHNKNVWPY
jgi:hypothetical protein